MHRLFLDRIGELSMHAQYTRGQRIYAREDPVDHWFRVESGMARKSIIFAATGVTDRRIRPAVRLQTSKSNRVSQ